MILFTCIWFFLFLCATYRWTLIIASIPEITSTKSKNNKLHYAIALPAHNEEKVIGSTIRSLLEMDYPSEYVDIFVVADFCSDQTAQEARNAGAICFERNEGERDGKGGALIWLFEQIFFANQQYDAIAIFDADTQVNPQFLTYITQRFDQGAKVIQGRHIISNPEEGWYPALAWALMTIDNRYNNQGRHNMKLSAKHMGDSICFRSHILRRLGWGESLTDDYEFRLRLLLEGVRIEYEPRAIGFGQAPLTWKEAQTQRLRWLKGVTDARQRYSIQLLLSGIKNRNLAQLDGAFSSLVPSYTTLTLLSLLAFLLSFTWDSPLAQAYRIIGAVVLFFWFLYPIIGLALERAPRWAYLIILTGPAFMLWRSFLRLRIFFSSKAITWVRTNHHK